MTEIDPAALSSGDVCEAGCPVARAARIIEGKWTTLIVRELLGGPKRFSALHRALAGVSAKVLTERLKFLEQQGLVARRVYPTNPPQTDYGLTPLGAGLRALVLAMADFGLLLAQADQAARPRPPAARRDLPAEGA